MNEPRDPSGKKDLGDQDIPGDQLTFQVLKMAVDVGDRPIDRVIRRLEQDDGPAWFEDSLRDGPLNVFDDPASAMLAGEATLAQLRKLKAQSKNMLRNPPQSDESLFGIAGYFIATAAALSHYQIMISSSDREDLNPMLLDLAGVLPQAWSDLLAKAAFADRP